MAMNYRGLLHDILPENLGQPTLLEEVPRAKYIQMIKQGEQLFQQILAKIPAQQRAAVAILIIKAILSKTAPAGQRWRARPKWAPVREDVIAEAMTINQQVDGIASYIATGLSGLNLEPATVKQVLSQMIHRLKGKMEWNINTPRWQAQNMYPAVKRYVDRALAQGQGTLRFDASRLNQSTQTNMLHHYNQALREHGLVGRWQRQNDGTMILDFRAAMELQKLADAETKLAQQHGPDAHGRLTLNVGTVAQRLVAQGLIDASTAQHVFQNQLRKRGIDPAQVVLTADEPGARRQRARPTRAPGRLSPYAGGKARVDYHGNPTHDIYGEPIGREENWDLPLEPELAHRPAPRSAPRSVPRSAPRQAPRSAPRQAPRPARQPWYRRLF
jgi:hypothetical protein